MNKFKCRLCGGSDYHQVIITEQFFKGLRGSSRQYQCSTCSVVFIFPDKFSCVDTICNSTDTKE